MAVATSGRRACRGCRRGEDPAGVPRHTRNPDRMAQLHAAAKVLGVEHGDVIPS